MANKKWMVLAVGAVGVLSAGIAFAFMPGKISVDVARLARGPFAIHRTSIARTRVVERFTVAAPVGGHLGRIALRVGDTVVTGQTIAAIGATLSPIMDARSRAELTARKSAAEAAALEAGLGAERARIAETQAARDLERARLLNQDAALPKARLEEIASLAELRAQEVAIALQTERRTRREVEVARAASSDAGARRPGGLLTVHSPASGKILRILASNEGPVTAGTPLVEIGDPATLEIAIELPSTLAVQVSQGGKVEFVRWGGKDPLAGIIRTIEPAAFTKITALGIEEQRVLALATPKPDPRWQALGDGYQMDARITTYERPDALAIPVGAIFRDGSDYHAFVVENGFARKRKVAIGEKDDLRAEILGGLTENTQVVLYPGDGLKDGSPVTPR
jgi:HlyD family secretion protein